MLTTITTCAGLLPTAYGLLGETDIFVSAMVFAMFWGLVFGTMSALFVVPLIYIIVDSIIGYVRGMVIVETDEVKTGQ